VSSVASPARDVGPCLCIDYAGLKGDRVGRISTPMLPGEAGARYGGAAQVQACPRLYSGMTVALEGLSDRDLAGAAAARLFVRHFAADGTPSALASGPLRRLQPGKALRLSLKVPDTGGWPVKDLGVEIRGEGLPRSPGQSRSRRHEPASGRLYVHAVRLSGRPRLSFPVPACMARSGGVAGWVFDADAVRNHPFSDDAEPVVRLQKNQGRGVMVTGTDDWTDYTLSSRVNVHLAAAAGLIVRYQGLQRYLALIQNGGHLALVERYYRDTVLGQVRARWQVDELHALKVVCRGRRVRAYCDGNLVAEAQDQRLGRGGAGYLVESGLAGFRDTLIT